jgi:hypothetical protein
LWEKQIHLIFGQLLYSNSIVAGSFSVESLYNRLLSAFSQLTRRVNIAENLLEELTINLVLNTFLSELFPSI